MISLRALIVLAICLPWSSGKLNTYCSICAEHTMCKYEGIGPACENVGEGGVNLQERAEIVDVHNWLRRVVASGYESKGVDGPQPKAADMRKLVWDDDLAVVAQRWADQCHFQHDTCRNDPRWNVGQNIYWKWKYPRHQVNWTEAILSWYNEVTLYNAKEVEAYRFEAATGHYTQMLWHDTYAIGCGRRDYGPNKLYVCNYGPAGNWIGEPLYTVGEPCSQCPRDTYCEEDLCILRNITEAAKTDILENRVADTNDTQEEKTLEVLTPPKVDAEHIYHSENKQSPNTSHTTEHKIVKEVFLDADGHSKTTTNFIDADEIELDEETKNEIDKIKHNIEVLVKRAIKRQREGKN